MKGAVLLLILSCSGVWSTKQCCANDEPVVRPGHCGATGIKVGIHCSNGFMVVRDIALKGENKTKLYSRDLPDFLISENPNEYCVGRTYINGSAPSLGMVSAALVCYEAPPQNFNVTAVLTLISSMFLLATVAVYMLLPQMRDLQGQCYMCMCFSMAIGFFSLGILQFSPSFRNELCAVTGFLVYFWMIATFFWMNVISINLFRTIQDSEHLKKTARKQFFVYCCYGWGGPLFLLMVALIANYVDGNHYRPGFGGNFCWFNGRTETWLYFYGPVAMLVTANVILFIISSYTLWKQTKKYEVNTLNVLKHKFLLSMKLFIVMGISWIFEIVSFAHGQQHIIWTIADTFNCLQGVVIFILLVVLRRRAIKGLVGEGLCLPCTRPLAEMLSPHDDFDDQEVLADETVEVRLH